MKYLDNFVYGSTILILILGLANLIRYYSDLPTDEGNNFVKFIIITYIMLITVLFIFIVMSTNKLLRMDGAK